MKKSKIIPYILLISILMNVLFVVFTYYIMCVKTDFYDRLCSKFGFGTYSVVDNRHYIEHRCLQGWSNTLSKLNVKADVVFYGNSITYGSDFQKDYPDLLVINMGCNRDDLDDLINRSFLIKSVRPHKIFVLAGINGIKEIQLSEFKRKYEILVDSIKTQNPNSIIYLQSILPVNTKIGIGSRFAGYQGKIKDANNIIRSIAENRECTYVDIFSLYQIDDSLPQRYTSDGLHLKPEAYSIWSRCLESYLR